MRGLFKSEVESEDSGGGAKAAAAVPHDKDESVVDAVCGAERASFQLQLPCIIHLSIFRVQPATTFAAPR